jgi:hypothetical protein
MNVQYAHTQKAPLAYLLAALALVMLVLAFSLRGEWFVTMALTAAAGVILALALAFRSLTVSMGDHSGSATYVTLGDGPRACVAEGHDHKFVRC